MIFKCPHCLYRSDKKHLYLGHIRSHTGEKPFKCRYCDYRCAQSGNRLVHERRMHEFNKPYKCKYCTYDAVQSSTLRKHIQIRHKEYCRYFCFTCKDFYCQEESTLAAHLDKRHGMARRKSIDAYHNPNYQDDSNVVVKEYIQTRGRPRANKGAVPPGMQGNPDYPSYVPPTQEPPPSQVVKQEPPSPFSSGLQSATSPTFPTQVYKSTTQPAFQYNTSQPNFAGSDQSSVFPEHNLVSPTGNDTTADSVENDLVDFSSLTGDYKCNQCSFQTSEEQTFMNHLVTNHSGTAVVDPNGLNSANQSAQNASKNLINESQINDNPFHVSNTEDEDAAYEQDLPTEKDISDLQLGVKTEAKPPYSSPLSTTLSSPVQSDVDQQNLNLTPSPAASTSRQMNDNTSSTSRDSALTSSTNGNQGKRLYRCRHCDIIFPDNILFAIHRGAHGFHQPFQCNLCGQDCANKYNFASHLQGCAM